MSDPRKLADTLIAIENGELDDSLNDIYEAVFNRRQILRQRVTRQKLKTMGVGDRVRIISPVKPQYLAGWEGQITEVRRGGKMVLKGRPIRKFTSGIIVAPVSMLEKVNGR